MVPPSPEWYQKNHAPWCLRCRQKTHRYRFSDRAHKGPRKIRVEASAWHGHKYAIGIDTILPNRAHIQAVEARYRVLERREETDEHRYETDVAPRFHIPLPPCIDKKDGVDSEIAIEPLESVDTGRVHLGRPTDNECAADGERQREKEERESCGENNESRSQWWHGETEAAEAPRAPHTNTNWKSDEDTVQRLWEA